MLSSFARSVRIAVLVLTLGLGACTQQGGAPNDPKARLQDYISKSFAVTSPEDRKELLGYMTGNAKSRLASWSDDQFREAFMSNRRQFVKLAFRDMKPVSKQEMNITYELTYMDQSKSGDARVTNKKICQMVLDQGKWFIADVHNVKQLVEYKNEMSLP